MTDGYGHDVSSQVVSLQYSEIDTLPHCASRYATQLIWYSTPVLTSSSVAGAMISISMLVGNDVGLCDGGGVGTTLGAGVGARDGAGDGILEGVPVGTFVVGEAEIDGLGLGPVPLQRTGG